MAEEHKTYIQFHNHSKLDKALNTLLGLVLGIGLDGKIAPAERGLFNTWLNENKSMSEKHPYNELIPIINRCLEDDKTITAPVTKIESSIVGVCAVCPEIVFEGAVFCFTGESKKFSRTEFAELVKSLGANISKGVTKQVNYLIIGAEGNPCWTYSCYGRKVEKAVELRKAGSNLLIVHEYDFHDAVADLL